MADTRKKRCACGWLERYLDSMGIPERTQLEVAVDAAIADRGEQRERKAERERRRATPRRDR